MLVEELLKSRSLDFKPSGKDLVIRCLNPEHEDRNPSMRIDRTTGIFNCMSCGFSGNLFNHFGEKINFLDSRRTRLMNSIIKKLAQSSGLTIPENAVPFKQDWRGISAATFERFEAFQHNNPEFIGRVVIPIRSITDKIVSFCGRHQGQNDPKYLFHPSGNSLPLFPLVKPIQGRVILVEGIMDMMNLHDKGLTNAVCAFGVNKVKEDKINILKIQGVSAIDIFFDNDDAGQLGAENLKELLEKHEMPSRNITMPGVKDPGELTASKVIRIKERLYNA
jgi:DNA primase